MSEHIANANPNLLDELFSRDPLGLADADLDMLVDEFRRIRTTWEAAPTKARVKKAPGVKVEKASLEDLGFE